MKVGDVVDSKYRIEALLGEGGMGRVYAATHVTLDATFAIKVLKSEALSHPEVPHRFMREARAASRLRNEHVVRVSDIGQLPTGEPYMVMEMLHGYDLATRLQKGALEVARAVEYIVQACEGLAEAHAHGMVHRDIKPANLFVTTRPNGAPLIKLLDFGIATAAVGEVDHRLTTTQSVIGSPSYMSPEQLRATRDVDARSDIWSLGVTLYELLSDRQPFVAPTITALSLQIVSEPHAPIAGIPDELMSVLDRCLEKERAARFDNVAELAAALAPFCPEGKLAAEMVSGILRNPVPPTIEDAAEVADDPSRAAWRLPSAPNLTTTGLAAGESSARAPARRRRTGWIALAAAAASGGIATALVLGLSARESTPATPPAAITPGVGAPTSPAPGPSMSPGASTSPGAGTSAAPGAGAAIMPDPSTSAGSTSPGPSTSPGEGASQGAGASESSEVASPDEPKPAKRPKKPSKRPRPTKPATTTTKPATPTTTKPPTTTTTKPPPVEPADKPPPPPPPPPKKPTPCDPSDKTCGL